jgi:hypothetical protein
MVGVLLIGFRYSEAKTLSSVPIDLCRFFYYYEDLGYHVEMISDISRITHQDVDEWCHHPDFDPRIFDLFSRVSQNHNVSTTEELLTIVSQLSQHNWSLIYFTGHGIPADRGRLDTPYGTIDVDLLFSIKGDQDRCVILDCCHCPIVDLPYQFKEQPIYVKSGKSRKENLIVFASSQPGEKSLMTETGSVMSEVFLRFLNEKTTDLGKYTEAIEVPERGVECRWRVYMSRPEKSLWGWVVGQETYRTLLEPPWQIIRTEKNESDHPQPGLIPDRRPQLSRPL